MRVSTFFLFYAFVTTLMLSTVVLGHSDGAYNCDYSDPQASYPNWMRVLADSTPLSLISMPGSHETMADCPDGSDCDYDFVGDLTLYDMSRTQVMTLSNQLQSGIRVLDIRLKWYESDNQFQIHHGSIAMNRYFVPDVLEVVKEFLTRNPTEVVIMRVKREQPAAGSGETEALSNTLLSYSNYIVSSTCVANTHLVLGPKTGGSSCNLRGKMLVYLDGFAAGTIDAKAFSEAKWPPRGASVQDNYNVPSAEYLYDIWESIKTQFDATINEGGYALIYINFLSGSSLLVYPWFVASGHDDPVVRPPHNDDGRMWSGKFSWDNPYPDFPRCCDDDHQECYYYICYEGMNMLSASYMEDIIYTNYHCAQPCTQTRVGLVLSDFAGRRLIESVLNSNGRIGPNSLNITTAVLNRPPIAKFTSAELSSREGDVITFDASPSSDPEGDALTFKWDLLGAVGCVQQGSSKSAVAKFLCSQNQNSQVQVTVLDTFGGLSTAVANFVVNNVAPTVSLQRGIIIHEGETASLAITITDPGTMDNFISCFMSWGESSDEFGYESFNRSASSTGTQTFTLSHRYLDNPTGTPSGNFTVGVLVRDEDQGVAINWTVITVVNVNPTVSLQRGLVIYEGDTASVAITITDPGILDTFSGTMDWGDGSLATPFVRSASSTGTQTFTLSHRYLDNPTGAPSDNYTVSVVVFDDDGGNATDSAVISVVNRNPIVIVSLTDELGQVLGSTVSFLLPRIGFTTAYNISDFGVQDHHDLLLSDWGDGSSDVVTVPTPLPSHAYNSSGNFTLNLTATDDDNGIGIATQIVPVFSQSDALAKVIKMIKKKLSTKDEANPVMYLSKAINYLAGRSLDKTQLAIKSIQNALVALAHIRALSSFGSIVTIQLLTAKSLALDAIAKSTKSSPEVVQKANTQILNGDKLRNSDPVKTTGFYLKAAKLLAKG